MTSRHDEQGMALVVVLAAILLLSTLGAALVLTTTAESLIAAHFRTGVEALAAADGMLARTLDDLRAVPDWSAVLRGEVLSPFMDGSPIGTRPLSDGSVLDLVRIVNQANCGHDAACRAAEMDSITIERPWGTNNPRWRVFASGTLPALAGNPLSGPSLHVVALVADDGMENDGDPAVDGGGGAANPGWDVIEVRAEAYGPMGTHRSVEATVARSHTDGVDVAIFPPVRVLAWREVR